MGTVLIAVGAFFGYLIAYNTYGKFLARKVFELDDAQPTPAHEFEDGQDFVPTRCEVLFGHHFASIAGTGPIVGPAIAIIWGWVPALLWVFFGAIFMGAVHDFSALVLSVRHQGRSMGDIAGDVVNGRVRTLFLLIIFFGLVIVIAIFCLVIARIFDMYPESVFPVWIQLPIAMAIGHLVYRKGAKPLVLSLIGVAGVYAAIVIGAYWPLKMPEVLGLPPVIVWTAILLVYAYFASVLPVWRLLQPRDYINGHQLFIALGLLLLGILLARPDIVAPAVDFSPEGAPPMWPMLFVTVACGAISGFHCLVSSGTSSKQLGKQSHALPIGYGGMLTEGFLAVLVIIAVAAGIGMAREGVELSGVAAWREHYRSWGAAQGLGANIGAFVTGSANLLDAIGLPPKVGTVMMGVFVACFAGTTLDTATRLQRYVVAELARGVGFKPLTTRHGATLFAVVTAAALAFPKKGTGGLILWPLFGATNQLLACLALLVTSVYLHRRAKPFLITLIPMCLMFAVTAWAMAYNLKTFFLDPSSGAWNPSWHLILIGAVIMILEIWMVIESLAVMASGRKPSPASSQRPPESGARAS
ncbi:MAG TPA: carbon starvation protein A [Sumerlaeia bacterium]|nr:carbon starvation protein A [Sumerlaeia bacterium]